MFVPALCNSRPQKQGLPCFAFLTRFNLYDVGAPNAQLCQQHMSVRCQSMFGGFLSKV